VAAQFPQRWLRGYVGSKLRRDPIFEVAYDLFHDSDRPILDVGCGLGLLGFYLRERGCRQPIRGLDLDARKIRQGNEVAQRRYEGIELCCQDIQKEIPEFCGEVVLFDVLHYLPIAQQVSLLSRLKTSVIPGGVLVVRDCLRDNGTRFWMTWAAEKFAQVISWNLNTSLHFPSLKQLDDIFDGNEFHQQSKPMWGRSPFNNYLFVFRKLTTNGHQ